MQVGFSPSNFDSTTTTALTFALGSQSISAARALSNIWVAAQDVQAKIVEVQTTLYKEKTAYSIVASQSQGTALFARVCVDKYMILNYFGNSGSLT